MAREVYLGKIRVVDREPHWQQMVFLIKFHGIVD